MCFVVLYDASGVRRAAGLTAARVNSLRGNSSDPNSVAQDDSQKPLKENLGHTRLEVLVGSVIGPLIALPGLVLLGSPLQLVQRLSPGMGPLA